MVRALSVVHFRVRCARYRWMASGYPHKRASSHGRWNPVCGWCKPLRGSSCEWNVIHDEIPSRSASHLLVQSAWCAAPGRYHNPAPKCALSLRAWALTNCRYQKLEILFLASAFLHSVDILNMSNRANTFDRLLFLVLTSFS